MAKYIYLYENYTEIGEKGLPKSHTWSDIRDTINLKKPFMILDFEDKDGMDQCISSEMHREDYSEQSYNSKDMSGKVITVPSIFVFCSDSSYSPDNLLKRFKIKRVIMGAAGQKYPKLYLDGDPVEFGSDIMTGISPTDMGGDNYYQNGSTYYKFLN